MNNTRKEIMYQKTEFNNWSICMLPQIIKCSKCKKNNTVIPELSVNFQNCLFCGNPNYVKERK